MPQFEIHITVEPVEGERRETLKQLAKLTLFRVADLFMVKRLEDTPERSKYDSFLTGHAASRGAAEDILIRTCLALKNNNFKIWRYKIEEILMDSRDDDELELL